jgi:hypothetical protein
MKPSSISRLIFETIPQIFEAENGHHPVDLNIAGEESEVFSMLPLSDELRTYLRNAVSIWEELRPMTDGQITQSIEREWVQQKFAVAWLEAKTGISNWPLILDYFRKLSRRTTENQQISKTIVIEPSVQVNEIETAFLQDESYYKVFDWLGSTTMTYYRVDEKLGIKALEAVSLTEIKDLKGYRFYPDRLHPIIGSLRDPKSIVVHLSGDRALLIANREGVIASKLIGESWRIYDKEHLIASVASVMERQMSETPRSEEPYCVACSLLQILFDISMKRHGGLIVLDHPENVARYVIKGIERDALSPLNRIFTHSPFNGLEFSIPEVRKLVELSAVDGALVLDLHGNLVQVGSMVLSHPSVLSHFGTRDAAGFSAAKFGATAFKISADGKVTLFFTLPSKTGTEVHRFDLM